MTSSSRRSPITHTAAMLAAMAILVAGCGIKAGLEPPRNSNAAEVAPDTSAPVAASRTAQEKSSIQAGTAFTLLPPQTPPEWVKEKQEMKEKRNPSTNRPGSKSTAPDKPFILDSLL